MARTWQLLAALGGLTAAVGYWAGGLLGLFFYAAVAIAISLAAYFGRDRAMLLALRARRIQPWQAPELAAAVLMLSRRAGIQPPPLYWVDWARPNAFVVGRGRNPAIVVTRGLLQHVPRAEIEAVLAHEIAHIRHGDLSLAVVASGLAGAVGWGAYLSGWSHLLAVLAGIGQPGGPGGALLIAGMLFGVPLLALLLRMALNREREFAADRGAAALTGSPRALARALLRLEGAADPWFSWRALVLGRGGPTAEPALPRLLRTHPSVDERVRRLLLMDTAHPRVIAVPVLLRS